MKDATGNCIFCRFDKLRESQQGHRSTKEIFLSGNCSVQTGWPNIVIKGYIIAEPAERSLIKGESFALFCPSHATVHFELSRKLLLGRARLHGCRNFIFLFFRVHLISV